jgi:type 1 glutamine amidotransferase
VTSAAFTGGDPFRFKEDARPRVVMLSAEDEYGAAQTLPAFAGFLARAGGLSAEVVQGDLAADGPARHRLPGIEALRGADLAVLFMRRRALLPEELQVLKEHLARGKPLIALRTTSHGLAVRGAVPPGCVDWKTFDRDVLGCTYAGYPHGETRVMTPPAAGDHPILEGLRGPYQVRETLYRTYPLAPACRVLLVGSCVDGSGDNPRYRRDPQERVPDEPVAWTTTCGGARIFYTSLGSSTASFATSWYRRMLVNAVFWALDRPVPATAQLAAGE